MVYGRRRKAIGRMVQKRGGTYMLPKSAAKAGKKMRENFEESHAYLSEPVAKGHLSDSSFSIHAHNHGHDCHGAHYEDEQVHGTQGMNKHLVQGAGGHSHIPAKTNEKVVMLGFLLTFGFMLVEFVGGYISGSLALMADAGHMLIDASALALAWAGFYFG